MGKKVVKCAVLTSNFNLTFEIEICARVAIASYLQIEQRGIGILLELAAIDVCTLYIRIARYSAVDR